MIWKIIELQMNHLNICDIVQLKTNSAVYNGRVEKHV